MKRRASFAPLALVALLASCVSSGDELRSLAEAAPLDCSVLVTGGAFLAAQVPDGTFAPPAAEPGPAVGSARAGAPEAIPIGSFAEVLERGRVFQRVRIDGDAASRERMSRIAQGRALESLPEFLARARADGHDYLLVVEELQDGAIDGLGTNGRWPVTFATWFLLGVGALIPDRTFESRAALRVTLRELQMGRVLHDRYLDAVPIELALVERTDFWGLLLSIVVPPFWVGDDREAVRAAVRESTERRLLLSLARELKSESLRQRLRELVPADLALVAAADGHRVRVRALEALSVARLRADVEPAAAEAFAQALLASVQRDGNRYVYEALLPAATTGRAAQILVGTLRGGVASATFVPGSAP